jgi:hypothetical protein
MPMAMRVPPVETKRKPRNSAMSLSAFDDFMNPIVAGGARCCLETLVPVFGSLGECGHQHGSGRQGLRKHDVASSDSGTQPSVVIS